MFVSGPLQVLILFHDVYPFGICVMFFLLRTCSKTFSFPLHPVFLHWPVDRVFFHDFGKSYFICIAWHSPGIFEVPLINSFSFTYFGCIVSLLCCCLFLVSSFHCCRVYFSFFRNFTCCHSHLICPSNLISCSNFVFPFRILRDY